MYSGNYISLKAAAKLTQKSVLDLLEMAIDGDLAVYAHSASWRQFTMENQFKTYSLTSPVLIDDEILLTSLLNEEEARLVVTCEQKVICRSDANDDNFLDGVSLEIKHLYCLKRDAELIVVGDDDEDNQGQRKALKPLSKVRNECLVLIHELTIVKNVGFLDELSGVVAWGLLVDGSFTSKLIKTRPTLNGTILFNDGSKTSRKDFLNCYRRRFE